MANTKMSAFTAETAPDGRMRLRGIDEVPADRGFYLADANAAVPNGILLNGKISVTVASNNITVALKTLSGANPSATDPVTIWLNGTYRRCTAATSVTKNAGTNWFNAGSAELATNEIDYFVYLIWNTTPATDIVDIGFARISHGQVYSDFSGTSTNEKYLAFGNASTPTSTDDVTVIGRFAATLSAGAGYTWSVPTFTNANLIQYPIFETRFLSWTPTHSRSGTAYSNAPSTSAALYHVEGKHVMFNVVFTQNGTPGGTGNARFSLPFSNIQTTTGHGYNASSSVLMFLAMSSSSPTVASVIKYDGTAEATASNVYVNNGTFLI